MLPAPPARHPLAAQISAQTAHALTNLTAVTVAGTALLATVVVSAPFLLIGPFIPAWQAAVDSRIGYLSAWSSRILSRALTAPSPVPGRPAGRRKP